MEIAKKKLNEVKKSYKEWCGMHLELREYNFETITNQINFTKRLLIDEAESEADRMVNLLYRIEVKL